MKYLNISDVSSGTELDPRILPSFYCQKLLPNYEYLLCLFFFFWGGFKLAHDKLSVVASSGISAESEVITQTNLL